MTSIRGTAPLRWRAAPQHSYLWADYEGDCALYHRPSGQTHFLNAATVYLLQVLLVEPIDAESAGRALASAAGGEEGAVAKEAVEALLSRLEELGLVERVA